MKPLTELRIMGVRLFRQEFSRLTEPVVVISRNEIKGVWTPGTGALAPETAGAVDDFQRWVSDEPFAGAVPRSMPVPDRKAAQAQRDAILNRVNRGRKP